MTGTYNDVFQYKHSKDEITHIGKILSKHFLSSMSHSRLCRRDPSMANARQNKVSETMQPRKILPKFVI